MPELPEVETIKRGLNKLIISKTIKQITIQNPKSFIGNPADALNLSIKSLHRRGKAFIVNLDNQLSFVIHLRMTGQLVYVSPSQSSREGEQSETAALPTPGTMRGNRVPSHKRSDRFGGGHPTDSFTNNLPDRHTRVQITFTDNSNLFFNDQRKFGFVKLLSTSKVGEEKFFQTLGPEPLESDLTASEFHRRLQKHHSTTIKAALLDQTTVAGVGNIYADESLFFARVHPARRVSSITKSESAQILAGIRKTMTDSLNSGGSTIQNYVKSDGTKGDYLDLFAQVFGKTNTPCPRCKTPISKTRVAGRGTHFCPNCQKVL